MNRNGRRAFFPNKISVEMCIKGEKIATNRELNAVNEKQHIVSQNNSQSQCNASYDINSNVTKKKYLHISFVKKKKTSICVFVYSVKGGEVVKHLPYVFLFSACLCVVTHRQPKILSLGDLAAMNVCSFVDLRCQSKSSVVYGKIQVTDVK